MSGCSETIITSAFQAEVAGLIPATRTKQQLAPVAQWIRAGVF